MSSALVAAYKFALQTSGGSTASLNHPPSFYAASQTPVTVAAFSVIFTAQELADTKVVGTPTVNVGPSTIVAGTNRRSNAMFVYDSTLVATLSGAIRTYADYRMLVDGGNPPNTHQYRFYIYNEVTTAWVQLDIDDSSGGVRTMQGQVITDLDDYVDGSGNINSLVWDFEGTRNPGSGCMVQGTLIHTVRGKVAVESLKVKDEVYCLVDGERVVRYIADITKHYAATWDLVEICAGAESVILTPDHPFPTEAGIGRGESAKNGDKMIGVNGFEIIDLVRPHEENIEVYDLSPADATSYFVGPGDGIVIYESDAL